MKKWNLSHNTLKQNMRLLWEAAKEVFFLVVRPLGGEGGKDRTTKEKNLSSKKSSEK